MTSKTTVGVFDGVDVFRWSVGYELSRPTGDDADQKKPDPRELEYCTGSTPMLRAFDNFLFINLFAAFNYLDFVVGVQVTMCDEAADSVEFMDVEH